MKSLLVAKLLAVFILGSTSIYGATHPETIIKQSFTHKFGADASKEEWESRGKTGQVVSTQANGVTITQNFYKGILQGNTTYSFPKSPIIQRTEVYEDGTLLSTIYHYPSGNRKVEIVPINSTLAQVTNWYEDGTPRSVEEIDNSLTVNGLYYTPLNAEESKVAQGFGVKTVRDNKGELLFKDTIQNGVIVLRTTYYPTGEPLSLTTYENGIVHGTHKIFDETGVPKEIQEWTNGRRQGLTTLYANGEPIAEIPYVKDRKEGIERHYQGSAVVLEVSWLNGLKNGATKKYTPTGKEVQWFALGQPISTPKFFSSSKQTLTPPVPPPSSPKRKTFFGL
jgi:antitoxin component YwqK of YwqJK toxin-antitoxin module